MAVLKSPLAVVWEPMATEVTPLAVVLAPMAVLKLPLAVVWEPSAVDSFPLAAVSVPMAVDPGPLAVTWSPMAVDMGPLAVAFRPAATESPPTLGSSHCAPKTTPARKAPFPGYHISRVPAPVAGIAPLKRLPPTTKPPSVFTCACPARLAAPLTVSCPSVTGPARNPPVASRCTSVLGTLSDVPLAGVTGVQAVPFQVST